MKYKDFNITSDGFVGHMAEPDGEAHQAVIIIMGGEKSLLPGIKIAERFADYGIIGLSLSLFGAEGLPKNVDLIPVDMFEPVVRYLREEKHIKSVSMYGMSMGSIFAALAGKYIQGIDNIILVSPSHVPFEGTLEDKKHMTGHSMATWRNEEIPYVKPDFSSGKMGKYYYEPEAGRKVTGMWIAYREAYKNKKLEQAATIHIEETNASHLIVIMLSREREKWLYRMIPVIGLMYRSFGKHKKECMWALEESEKEIIKWIKS